MGNRAESLRRLRAASEWQQAIGCRQAEPERPRAPCDEINKRVCAPRPNRNTRRPAASYTSQKKKGETGLLLRRAAADVTTLLLLEMTIHQRLESAGGSEADQLESGLMNRSASAGEGSELEVCSSPLGLSHHSKYSAWFRWERHLAKAARAQISFLIRHSVDKARARGCTGSWAPATLAPA